MQNSIGVLILALICLIIVNFPTPVKVHTVNFYPKRAVLDYPSLPSKLAISRPKVDPNISKDWALVNIGFFEVFTELVKPILSTTKPCSKSVVVAVIDTGIDYTHPELRPNLWTNSKEIAGNGIDDDKNDFIDDEIGWDFVHDVALPYDIHGHGTHIAGIIAAVAANGIGSTGVCPTVTIMPLKYYDNSGSGYNNLSNTVRAINYAVKMGAHIINYSGGGSDPSPTERSALIEAQKKGVLLVAAAGNEGRNNDRFPYYPANYGLDNIISVTSLSKNNELLPSSDFGKSVHMAAPGMMILSTLPEGKFGTMSGASQATAFVTGAAALLASQFSDDPRLHYKEVRQAIIDGSKPLKYNDLKNAVSGGVLNIPLALKALKK